MQGEYSGCVYIPAHPSNYRSGRIHNIDRVLIHVTQSDSALGSANYFAMDHRGDGGASSAHYVIAADGTIYQCVKEQDTAYGAPNYNARGIHIEHAGWVGKTHFPEAQLQASAHLVRHLCDKYAITPDRVHILGHSELEGNDHTDPGSTWPWGHYMQLVAGGQVAAEPIWAHPDGIHVPSTAIFGLKWPKGTHHGTIIADGRWIVYNGNPDSKIKILLSTKGARQLQATAYDVKNQVLGRDTLSVTVT